MSEITCPIECVREGCPEPDFLEKHSGFLITLIGSVSAVLSLNKNLIVDFIYIKNINIHV